MAKSFPITGVASLQPKRSKRCGPAADGHAAASLEIPSPNFRLLLGLIVNPLEVEPEGRTVATKLAEPERHGDHNQLLLVQDCRKASASKIQEAWRSLSLTGRLPERCLRAEVRQGASQAVHA